MRPQQLCKFLLYFFGSANPSTCIMVNGYRFRSYGQTVHLVKRTKIFRRVNGYACNFLQLRGWPKAMFYQNRSNMLDNRQTAGSTGKMDGIIIVEHSFVYGMMCFYRNSQPCGHTGIWKLITFTLTSHECPPTQNRLQTFYQLHIRIKIHSPLFIKNFHSGIVRNVSPLLSLIGFPHIRGLVNIKIRLIPSFYFISGHQPFPGLYTFADNRRQRISTKPKIMNDFRYHIKL